MIRVRRSGDRVHCTQGTHQVWHTFGHHGRTDPIEGLTTLLVFDEERLPPGMLEWECAVDATVVLYVCDGIVSIQKDDETFALVPGTCLHRSEGRAGKPQVQSTSARGEARIYRIGLPLLEGVESPGLRWSWFGTAQRRNGFRLVASMDGRDGTLCLAHDVCVYSAVLHPGLHVVQELGVGRGAWLHVVSGKGRMGSLQLASGDGVGLVAERAIAFTASEETELLVIDLPLMTAS